MAELKKPARSNSGVFITIRVVPRSSRVSITQESQTQYKIRLTSAPVEGAANRQLIKILSEKLSLPARSIQITHGETGRLNHVYIE
jgi:uncharacterized protein (TIGR00251 family)